MTIERMRWQGTTRRRNLLERLHAELDGWRRDWCVDGVALALALVDEGDSIAAERWLRLESKRGTLLLGATAAQLRGFGAALAQAEPDDALDWSMRVGRRALHALAARLLGLESASAPLLDATTPPARALDARHGALVLRLSGAGLDACIALDAAACESLLPTPVPAPVALVPREESLRGQSIELQVVLPLGSANLADTHGLQVGDVLVSDVPLDTPFDLLHPDQRRLARARLCRVGQAQSLLLESN